MVNKRRIGEKFGKSKSLSTNKLVDHECAARLEAASLRTWKHIQSNGPHISRPHVVRDGCPASRK